MCYHYNFSYFEQIMKSDPSIKITREQWNNINIYIYWQPESQRFMRHLPGYEDHEYDWDDFSMARDDVLSGDWKQVKGV